MNRIGSSELRLVLYPNGKVEASSYELLREKFSGIDRLMFVLGNAIDCDVADSANLQTVRLQRQASRHFSLRPSLQLLLPLLTPWRWRRTLLNLNVDRSYVMFGVQAVPFMIASVLSRTPLTMVRSEVALLTALDNQFEVSRVGNS